MAGKRGSKRKTTAGGQAGERLVDQCVTRILHEIHAGTLGPGQRLGEGMLSRRLNVGRAPIKAALDQLAFAGVVERRPRSGSYVGAWSKEDYLQLLHLRAALESMAGRLAATRISETQLAELAELAQIMDQQSPPPGQDRIHWISEKETAFHTRIAAASGNRWLVRALDDQRVIADCVMSWLKRPRSANLHAHTDASHTMIVQSLRSRDPELAARIMLTHILAGTGAFDEP